MTSPEDPPPTLTDEAIAARACSHSLTHEPTGWQVDPVDGVVCGRPDNRYRDRQLGRMTNRRTLVASSGGRMYALRRVVWEAVNAQPVPPGHLVAHRDGDPTNVRYANLVLRTQREHGHLLRSPGAAHPDSRLTAEQVREIRSSAIPGWLLAKRYGVGADHIGAIRRGATWKEEPAAQEPVEQYPRVTLGLLAVIRVLLATEDHPRAAVVATAAGITHAAAYRALDQLESAGWVQTEAADRPGHRQCQLTARGRVRARELQDLMDER